MRAWDEFLKEQEKELGEETVRRWLRPLKVTHFDACNLYLEAKDAFQLLWFKEHIRTKVLQKLVNGNYKRINVHISLAKGSSQIKEGSSDSPKKTRRNPQSRDTPFNLNFEDPDPSITLDNFIVNQENQLAFQLCRDLTQSSSQTNKSLGHFNPIFLYGRSGSGKTHLLSGIALALRAQGKKCLFIRSELFTDHVVSAIRAGEMHRFRQAYRNTDVLLVDDIHIFSRRGTTQEEFFHTFNTLHLCEKQIILTAHCPPKELEAIEPRLVSRFEWGITLPLTPLKPSSWKDILAAKAQALKFTLPQRIVDFLCASFTSSPKALIKALEAIIFRLHLNQKNDASHLTTQAAKTLLADLLSDELKNALTADKIIHAVAEYYSLSQAEILSKSQKREIVLPRQMAMYLCREKLNIPYMKIGDIFSRDHSTIMTGVKTIQKLILEECPEIVSALHAILRNL